MVWGSLLFSDPDLGLARKLEITAFDLAQRFVGTQELGGAASNPAVLAMLRLDQKWPKGDHDPLVLGVRQLPRVAATSPSI